MGWLVARVLAEAAGRLWVIEAADLSPAPLRMPRELVTRGEDATIADLLRRLRTDRGCVGPRPRRHLACAAASELGRRGATTGDVVHALEETVTLAARPACVRTAAIETLCAWQPTHGRRALARMHAVMRRRVEWEGGDRPLVRRMTDALR